MRHATLHTKRTSHARRGVRPADDLEAIPLPDPAASPPEFADSAPPAPEPPAEEEPDAFGVETAAALQGAVADLP